MNATEDKTYNGWTNYETWAVNLWMGNDQQSASYYAAMADTAWHGAEADQTFTREERATLDLMAALKDEFENESCDILEKSGRESSVWADLLNAALSEVNWHEIAEHFIDEVQK